MSKVLFVDYDNPGVFKVLSEENEVTQDMLQAVNESMGDLFRYTNRAGGMFEVAAIDAEPVEDEDGEETGDTDYSISHWNPIAP